MLLPVYLPLSFLSRTRHPFFKFLCISECISSQGPRPSQPTPALQSLQLYVVSPTFCVHSSYRLLLPLESCLTRVSLVSFIRFANQIISYNLRKDRSEMADPLMTEDLLEPRVAPDDPVWDLWAGYVV